MTYHRSLDPAYEVPEDDYDLAYERCAHGIDVDSPCEDCSPQSIPDDDFWYRYTQTLVRS